MERSKRWLARLKKRLADWLWGSQSVGPSPNPPLPAPRKHRRFSTWQIAKASTALVTNAVHIAGFGGNIAIGLARGIKGVSGCSQSNCHAILNTRSKGLAMVLDIDGAHEIVAAVGRRPKHLFETGVRWTSNLATGTVEVLKVLVATPLKAWPLSIPGGAALPAAPVAMSIASPIIIGAATVQFGLLALRLMA
jgi:hypothetical protein